MDFPSGMPPHLAEAYTRAVYRARGADGGWHAFTFAPGAASDDVAGLPFAQPWAIVTAWNPMSVARDNAANRAAHDELVRRVEGMGLAWRPSEAADPASPGSWREEGVVIEGIDRGHTLVLLREFGQLAAVHAEDGSVGLLFASTGHREVMPVRLVEGAGAAETPVVGAVAGEHAVVAFLRGRDVPCPVCEYNLVGSVAPRCTECGTELTMSMFARPWVMPRSNFVVFCYIGLTAWVAATVVGLLVALSMADTVRRVGPESFLPIVAAAFLVAELWLMVRWVRRPGRIHLMARHLRPWAWVFFAGPGVGVCVGMVLLALFIVIEMLGIVSFWM